MARSRTEIQSEKPALTFGGEFLIRIPAVIPLENLGDEKLTQHSFVALLRVKKMALLKLARISYECTRIVLSGR